jgi:hypothetical protein
MNKSCHTCKFGASKDCKVCNKCFQITSRTGKARELYESEGVE